MDDITIYLTPDEREAWYDAHVAPQLQALAADCVARGIPFLAVVGYDGLPGGSSGRTLGLPEHRAHFFCVMDAAARCWAPGGEFDFDKFALGFARDAQGKPHGSLVLSMMGVPAVPVPGAAAAGEESAPPGWKINNPAWPSGEGEHLIPEESE